MMKKITLNQIFKNATNMNFKQKLLQRQSSTRCKITSKVICLLMKCQAKVKRENDIESEL